MERGIVITSGIFFNLDESAGRTLDSYLYNERRMENGVFSSKKKGH
jgi:hypothetical protein